MAQTTVDSSALVAASTDSPPPAPALSRPRPKTPHHPGLDGVRGAAVAAVLLFHGGFHWARGGYLGVSTFFTLSGFLITGLLLAEWQRDGRVVLHRFWERRFRRLAPALLLTLLGIALFAATIADADQLARIRDDALATLGYVANWRFVLSGQSYAHLFDAPSPLLHAWSLAIEEQFYVVFPLLVVGVLRATRGRRAVLAGVLATLAVASVVTSIALHGDTSRVYYGTDTRAAELLLGALLAVWVSGRGADLHERRRPVVAWLGLLAAGLSVLAWATVGQSAQWLYAGGLALYALATTAVVAGAVAPGPLRRALSTPPLRFLGRVSYGVYLFHWPVFLWLSPARTSLATWPLFAVRVGVTLALAVASYRVIESPVRSGALSGWRAPALLPVVAGAVVVCVALATVSPGPPSRLVAEPAAASVATATGPVLPFQRAASAAAPLRVLLVGDSVAYDAAPGIEAALEATGTAEVTPADVLGFGLFQPYDWRHEWPRLLRESRAELVVAMWGGWDDGYLHQHGRAAYDAALDEAVATLGATGAKILFIGEPASVTRDGQPEPRESLAAHARLARRYPDRVWFLDSDAVVSPGGRFAEHLPGPAGPERVRKIDGAHLCPGGAARYGRAVLDAVTAAWVLPPPDPSWRAGAWALDRRYDDPPGACPD